MEKTDIDKLVVIMNELREKCPWDKKQTIDSLRQQTVEELYELTDVLESKDWKGIKEELGDMLMHIIFYSKIAQEENHFQIQDVINGICEKLIQRHPHIYGDVKVENAEDVKKNWERIKLKEGKKGVMSGIPGTMPSLIKSMRIQEKAAKVGFEWENRDDVWKKVEEEKFELLEALEQKDNASAEAEAGDLLFSIVNYIRFLKIDADKALKLTNEKFLNRFAEMENAAMEKDKTLPEMSLQEMDQIWNEIKSHQ
ncbi:MAG: nucleoside triphosphate pyrophosphohydrolase [Chitinophagaceae bacterium]|nr:nucleoside triphosphate pyrophosphohydrolase [Chitinophagaceae bacterium]